MKKKLVKLLPLIVTLGMCTSLIPTSAAEAVYNDGYGDAYAWYDGTVLEAGGMGHSESGKKGHKLVG